jgi:hypothetical protein
MQIHLQSNDMSHTAQILVKIAARSSRCGRGLNFISQCPGNLPQWGNCRFISDPFARDYDWLVVMDDLPSILPDRKETLACPRMNTLLVTSEPSSITRYGKAFAAQFGQVLTSQEAWALPHPHAIRSPTGNVWFYGKAYDEIIQAVPSPKTHLISTVCSSKQQAYTLHAQRYDFTQRLKAELPELDIFGHGVRYIEQKAESLDAYKFHLAIENHIAEHHWTEKLTDAFLGYTVPFYCGCPNVFDYFPKESIIPIDIRDSKGAMETIRQALTDEGAYERRFEAVKEARRLVIEKYNLPSMLSRMIEGAETSKRDAARGAIHSRRAMLMRHPADFVRFAAWRSKNFLHSL